MRQNPQRSTPNADPGPPPETCEQCGKTFGTRKEVGPGRMAFCCCMTPDFN